MLQTFIIWHASGATNFRSKAVKSITLTSGCCKKYRASGHDGISKMVGLILMVIKQDFISNSSQRNNHENVSILWASSITTTVPAVSRH